MKWDYHQRFDTSDHNTDNIYGVLLVNNKVLGMMMNENNGVSMLELIGLRSKLYAFKVVSFDGLSLKRKLFNGDLIKMKLLEISEFVA